MWNSWRFESRVAPATRLLLIVIPSIYIIQLLNQHVFRLPFEEFFGLSVSGMMEGRLWQLLTYQFLHGGPFHLLVNMLMFYVLGNEVERAIGTRHFTILYLLSGILGGLGWVLLTYPYEGVCVGASAAIFGVLSAFAVLYPQREITLLVFLILPITLKAWVLALLLGGVQLIFTISPGAGGIAYSAHLAGAVAGLFYTVVLFRPDWFRHTARRQSPRVPGASDSADVDRLLDKIAREGIHSLSPAERKRLEAASRRS